MFYWQPSKWVQYAMTAALPWGAAAWLSTDSLVKDISTRAAAAAGDWAKVSLNVRDATISGAAPSQDASDAIIRAIASTYGVRSVDATGITIAMPKAAEVAPKAAEPVAAEEPLVAPTITAANLENNIPVITGTWPEGKAKTLEVTVDNQVYKLGTDPELTSAAGNWTLQATAPLPAGTYSVTAKDGDGATALAATEKPAELQVAAPADPVVEAVAAPTIAEAKVDGGVATITGTWSEGKAKSLDVTVNAKIYTLGQSPELTSKDGNWVLRLSDLAPGSYAISAADGNGGPVTTSDKPLNFEVAAPVVEVLAAPTIAEAKVDGGVATITGTWPEGKAKSLDVTVSSKVYTLGQSPELSNKDGNWVLKLPDLAPGSYAVSAAVGNGGPVTTSDKPLQFEVAAPPPPAPEPLIAPTIDDVQSSGNQATIIGTWPEDKAKSLDVTVNDKTYTLGTAPELTSDAGKWTLKLTDLVPGSYAISASDGNGNQTASAAKVLNFEVAAPPPPPPKPLVAATLDPIKVETDRPVTITGTWPAGMATGLSVTVNDKTSVLGKDVDLLTDTNGKWKLTEPVDLAPGKYKVVVTDTNAVGESLQASGSFEISAPPPPPPPKAEPPAAPTIETATSDSDHPTVKGTWPVAAGNSLQVELDGVTHTLGKDFDLLSDASGKWKLTPAKPVVNGTYDVIAKVTAADGQSAMDASKAELTVTVAPPAPAPAAEEPYDCEATLAKIAAVFPIRFEFDHADLGIQYQQALGQYAALLNDPRCAALHVQVAGNADYLGPEHYNMGLSENRAGTVVAALTAAKIDAGRLSPIGNGTSKPLDPAHSNDARAKNRRVEFSVMK